GEPAAPHRLDQDRPHRRAVVRVVHSQAAPVPLETVEVIVEPEKAAVENRYGVLDCVGTQKTPVQHRNAGLLHADEPALAKGDACRKGIFAASRGHSSPSSRRIAVVTPNRSPWRGSRTSRFRANKATSLPRSTQPTHQPMRGSPESASPVLPRITVSPV